MSTSDLTTHIDHQLLILGAIYVTATVIGSVGVTILAGYIMGICS